MNVDKEKLLNIIKDSKNLKNVLDNLNFIYNRGNRQKIRSLAKSYNIDIDYELFQNTINPFKNMDLNYLKNLASKCVSYNDLIIKLKLPYSRKLLNNLKNIISKNIFKYDLLNNPYTCAWKDDVSLEQLRDILNNSVTLKDVIIKLGKHIHGNNYKTVRFLITKYHLEKEFEQLRLRYKEYCCVWLNRKLEDYLVKDGPFITSLNLKNKLIKANLLEEKCYSCGLTEWKSELTNWKLEKIPLELEHKDGYNRNNELKNLSLICPNCHTFTKTYRGKNRNRYNKMPL